MKRILQTFFVIVACCLLTAQAQLSWPPQFAVGQVWRIEIDSIGSWELEIDTQQRFSETYVFGGESKSGTDRRNLGLFFEKTLDAVIVLLVVSNSNDKNYACVATRAGNPRGNLIYGTTAKITSQNPLKSVNLKLECRMRLLKNVSTIAVPVTQAPPSPPVVQSPTPSPVAPTPVTQAPALPWPPVFSVGSTLTLTVPSQPSWSISIKAIDADGKTFRGEALRSTELWQVIVFFRTSDNALQADLLMGEQVYSCLFLGRQSVQGMALRGEAYYKASASTGFQGLTGSCDLRTAQ
jgi:hypothetical protein